MNYNIYAIDKIDQSEIDILVDHLPKFTKFRIGGEEYENKEINIDLFRDFIDRVEGGLSITAGNDFNRFLNQYEKFRNVEYVFFKNEIWHELTDWAFVKNDLFNYLFNRKKYYKKHAQKYVEDARDLTGKMIQRGHQIKIVLNVPIPQNQFLKSFVDEVGRIWGGLVSIHVYGKQNEHDYFDKLDSWLTYLKSKSFSRIICGEMNGLFNHAIDRELKNTPIHAEQHRRVVETLNRHGINEIYYFTLVANQKMMNWQNPPIYNRFLITGGQCVDTLDNVF